MLSGIGPADELKKHNIPLVYELPEVGKNLQDHCFSTATLLQKSGTNDRMTYETSPEAIAEAKAQHAKDKTGKLNEMYCGVPMGWFKNDAVMKSEEFQALDERTKRHLERETVPTMEIATVSCLFYIRVWSCTGVLICGSIRRRSSQVIIFCRKRTAISQPSHSS